MSSDQNTYVFNADSPTELTRLINLDQVTTQAMGGPLVGIDANHIPQIKNILDTGCGPGGWVLNVAFGLPDAEVTGVDTSRSMIDYANGRARTRQLSNASFGVMDIRRPLDFADGAFDLVNARYLTGVLKREDWVGFLQECLRLLRPGGLVRLTETDGVLVTTSPALSQLNLWLMQAMHRMGYGHSPDGFTLGVSSVLPSLLRKIGIKQPETFACEFDGSHYSQHHITLLRLCEIVYFQAQSIITKTEVAGAEEIKKLYQQMLIEIQRDDFCCIFNMRCIVGEKST